MTVRRPREFQFEGNDIAAIIFPSTARYFHHPPDTVAFKQQEPNQILAIPSFRVLVYVPVIHLDRAAPSRFHHVSSIPSPRTLRLCCRFRLHVLIKRLYDSFRPPFRRRRPFLVVQLFLRFSSAAFYDRVKYISRTYNYGSMSITLRTRRCARKRRKKVQPLRQRVRIATHSVVDEI